jgi:Cu(I)/Ag(I) efflux system membrane protein CusA/SilA
VIKKIISFSAHNKFIVLSVTFVLCVLGYLSIKNIPVDAIPDLSDTQVIIYTRWDQSPDIVENQVTYPIVTALLGAPKVKTVRGVSDYGFSYVYVIFEDGTDLYWARSRVLEYVNRISASLPEGAKSEIGPDATSVGWVYQYVLVDESGKLNTAQLRSLQDWKLKFQLNSVSGVAEVASVGGFVKQFQIKVDPRKLQLFQLTMGDVAEAVKKSNKESGGRVIEFSGTEAMVRSRALVDKVEDFKNIPVKFPSQAAVPILLHQIAEITVGPEMRRGITDYNGIGNTVGGIIVMRQGEDAPSVIKRVKNKLEVISKSLPPGVVVKSVYDRSDLIERALHTLKGTLVEELIVVSLVILIFLWHIPSALVPIMTIPISVLFAFIPLYLLGQSSNIMSLAGIAISIGVLVDGAIIEVENAYRKIEHWNAGGRKEDFHQVRLEALMEVGPSVFFSLLVIAVSFLPIFTLVDQEGRLFRPLALSKTLTMAVAGILAVTLDPAVRMLFARADFFHGKSKILNHLGNVFLVGTYYPEEKHPISKRLFKIYRPVLDLFLVHRRKVLAGALVLTLTIIPGLMLLGREFMPRLDEGSLLYMPTALPGLSVTEAQRVLTLQDKILKAFPEVESVFGKAGRAETSTDTAPLSMVETTIVLKEKSKWRKIHRWYSSFPEFLQKPFRWFAPDYISEEDLISEMNQKLNFLGMPNIWTMPIKNRIDMLSTGIRSSVGIKIYGSDLAQIQKVGVEAEKILSKVPNTRTAIAERISGGYFLDIDFNRDRLAYYGLSMEEAHQEAMTAIGGENVSLALVGRERYPIQVRYAPAFRQTKESIERVMITAKNGAQIPLKELARVGFREGASMIRDENASLVGYVYVDVDLAKTDIGSYVDNAKEAIDRQLQLPEGYTIEWSGQYENMQSVEKRLKLVVPLTLFLILLLLHMNTKSWTKTGLILLAIPFSMIGAVWLLYFLGYNLSIATWVGIIALLGLDAETGVFMLLYLDLAYEDRVKKGLMRDEKDLRETIIEGAVHRIRPKLMTVLCLFIGLIPIMWSSGSGADVMKRIAAPMIGGIVTSFILELLIYPVIYDIWKSREIKRRNS